MMPTESELVEYWRGIAARLEGQLAQARSEKHDLVAAAMAGITLFEYLGELLNRDDTAAEESPDNMRRIEAMIASIRNTLPSEAIVTASALAYKMLDSLPPGGESEG